VIERTSIGLWRASEILAEGTPEEDPLAQHDAMTFLEEAAKRGLCEVWGIQGHKTGLAKIEPALLEALELHHAAAPSTDSEEYCEAAYEPKTLGTDFYEQRWRELRYPSNQIAALKVTFAHWRKNGTFQASQTVAHNKCRQTSTEANKAQKQRSPAVKYSAFKEWYAQRIKTWPTNESPPSVAKCRSAANEYFETQGLSAPRKHVMRARRDLRAPASWLKPGPRSTNDE
jgi:hypothetical protein